MGRPFITDDRQPRESCPAPLKPLRGDETRRASRGTGYRTRMTRFGLVGSFQAQPGQGEALATLLVQAAQALEANSDCQLYAVSRSADDADSVWVTEVWTSSEAHQASLEDERVRQLIRQARPLIAGLGKRFELSPLGGKGLRVAD